MPLSGRLRRRSNSLLLTPRMGWLDPNFMHRIFGPTRSRDSYPESAMRYTLLHRGVPIGFTELAPGELAAGPFVALPTLGAIRETVRKGSAALLPLGFFGAAARSGYRRTGAALRAAAALEFELLNEDGQLTPATFVNLIEAPDGGLVVLARFGHAHAGVVAALKPKERSAGDAEWPPDAKAV